MAKVAVHNCGSNCKHNLNFVNTAPMINDKLHKCEFNGHRGSDFLNAAPIIPIAIAFRERNSNGQRNFRDYILRARIQLQ